MIYQLSKEQLKVADKPNFWITKAILFIDFVILNICFILTYLFSDHFDKAAISAEFVLFFIYINLCWYLIASFSGLYNLNKIRSLKNILFTTLLSAILFFFFFMLYFQVLTSNYIDRDLIKRLFIVFTFSQTGYKLLFHLLIPVLNLKFNRGRRVVIVGYNGTSKLLRSAIEQDSRQKVNFLGYFTDRSVKNADFLGTYHDFKNFLDNSQVDEVYLILNVIPDQIQPSILQSAVKQSVNIRIIPEIASVSQGSFSLSTIGDLPVLNLERGPLNKSRNLLLKRIFDVITSLIVISVFLSWLIPVIWVINWLFYRHGVFFVQKRNGLNNKTFRCIKFKTMCNNHDADIKSAEVKDARVTPVGRFLRKTSLDEMPQFFNVLMGHMSVVGPRPHMVKHTDKYRKLVNKFMIRHTVKPGLTGLAQIKGCRGSIRNFSHLRKRVQLDLMYIKKWSIWLDFKIFFLTIFTIFRGESNTF
ncbi:MAG: exopolysaccharide biosynthesis polyprenyl glycosylphosphotransferase [Bacteroidales bacterium]|nr:exopolysaccharide biosynthesis polyprenyl glycosylphosphotransferase [Bacteroidales bacterium]